MLTQKHQECDFMTKSAFKFQINNTPSRSGQSTAEREIFEMKALFRRSWYERHGKYQLKALEYEYKGYKYCVYVGDTQDTLFEQHQKEQNRIDSYIKIEEKAKKCRQSDATSDWDDILNDRI